MTINCGGKILSLEIPRIMAICNITSDSFYARSRVKDEEKLTEKVKRYLEEGADIIDVGGMSSRPGAEAIPVSEEIDRLTWALEIIRTEFDDALISIDTYRSEVVRAAMDFDINMVNDISGGGLDPELISTVAKYDIPYILMHMKGTPLDMQLDPQYRQGVVLNLLNYFKVKIYECREMGINDVIIDPGFGFGKSIEDNYKLLKSLESFSILDVPLLIGLSRKSMIYKVLQGSPGSALNGTTALHIIALQNGANLLRVHDVKEAKECIDLYKQINSI